MFLLLFRPPFAKWTRVRQDNNKSFIKCIFTLLTHAYQKRSHPISFRGAQHTSHLQNNQLHQHTNDLNAGHVFFSHSNFSYFDALCAFSFEPSEYVTSHFYLCIFKMINVQ